MFIYIEKTTIWKWIKPVLQDLEISNAKYELNRKRKRDKLEKSAQGVKWWVAVSRLATRAADSELGSGFFFTPTIRI